MRAAESARNTGELIESTVKKIRVGVEMVQQTNQEFNEVASMVTKSGELVGEIAAASHEQAQGIDHLNQAVQEMDKVVQRNAASAEETASITGEMNAQSALVKDMVGGLAALVGSGAHPAGDPRKPDATPPKAANAHGRSVQAGRPPARNGGNGNRAPVRKTTPKQLPPESVIPFEEDFRDF